MTSQLVNQNLSIRHIIWATQRSWTSVPFFAPATWDKDTTEHCCLFQWWLKSSSSDLQLKMLGMSHFFALQKSLQRVSQQICPTLPCYRRATTCSTLLKPRTQPCFWKTSAPADLVTTVHTHRTIENHSSLVEKRSFGDEKPGGDTGLESPEIIRICLDLWPILGRHDWTFFTLVALNDFTGHTNGCLRLRIYVFFWRGAISNTVPQTWKNHLPPYLTMTQNT